MRLVVATRVPFAWDRRPRGYNLHFTWPVSRYAYLHALAASTVQSHQFQLHIFMKGKYGLVTMIKNRLFVFTFLRNCPKIHFHVLQTFLEEINEISSCFPILLFSRDITKTSQKSKYSNEINFQGLFYTNIVHEKAIVSNWNWWRTGYRLGGKRGVEMGGGGGGESPTG